MTERQRAAQAAKGRFRLFSGSWGEIQATAVEVDRVDEVLFVAEAPAPRRAGLKDCEDSLDEIVEAMSELLMEFNEMVRRSDSVTHVIYEAAGNPPMPVTHAGICRACGRLGEGLEFESWVRDTFTDWNRLQAGSILCQACQFCFTDQNEVLTAKLGKDKPQRTRNYSHFVIHGEWIPLSKGDKLQMRGLLLACPDVAVIAISGQKHIIFRATPGWWQIEEFSLRPFPDALARSLELVERMYSGGFSKAEIESGRYQHKRILEFGLAAWRDAEESVRPLRGSPVLMLALFLAQKETENNGE